MMAVLGPWLRRIFAPVDFPPEPSPAPAPADDEPPDPITAHLDEAIANHRRVFQEARDSREETLKRLASTIDECLTRNTFRKRADG